MNKSAEKRSAYDKYCSVTNVVYKITLAICAVCLIVELIAVFVMVCGRFIFNNVPLWTDQMSLMALVWMSIISISLAFYDESHMRVELLDMFAPKILITILKYFSNVVIIVVSVMMVVHGQKLFDLTKHTRLSGFHVSEGLFYIPLVLCGLTSVYMNIFCIIRRIKGADKK